ncbi:MAG: D-alanyl-D-alanine carboxypeptidase [Alphaproteobacteria bacterium]|nr:D-alanyl-D-alanine carboxypeptidase [Alphaproteobacteria bacterium]
MKKLAKDAKKYKYLFLAAFILNITINTSAHASISSITIDADSGKVLSQYNADERRFPASLTKLMTLYLTFEALEKGQLKMTDKLPVSRHAANMEPSKLGLRAGQKVELKTLINALIVKSANDCAVVLAEALGKTESQFAQKMTTKAQKLGMKNTTFRNASGLPNAQQKTTARDMAKLATAIYNDFPQYYKLFSQKTYKYNGRTLYTHNHVLSKFKGADGMKTGYTRASGFNIVTSAQRKGNRVIAVTMGHKTLGDRDTKVMSMMERGLTTLAQNNRDKTARRYAQLQPIVNAPVQENNITDVKDVTDKVWGIQVGAFSNYTKARNYALQVKRTTLQVFKSNDISIEPVTTGAAVVYRSKIIGFAKNDADSACKKLKSKQQSCIVVAAAPTSQLASADRY